MPHPRRPDDLAGLFAFDEVEPGLMEDGLERRRGNNFGPDLRFLQRALQVRAQLGISSHEVVFRQITAILRRPKIFVVVAVAGGVVPTSRDDGAAAALGSRGGEGRRNVAAESANPRRR